jgi:hypothetical protein
VAYVRKVRTSSGAVAVQVARKDRGRVVVLAHVGSAHTDAELGILLVLLGLIVASLPLPPYAQQRAYPRGSLRCFSGPASAMSSSIKSISFWRISDVM